MARDVDLSSDRLGVVSQVRSVPLAFQLTSGNRVASSTGYEVGHLDEGMQLALLMDGAANEPLDASGDVRLMPVEASVEAVGDEILRCAERCILAIDHDQGQPRTWGSGALGQSRVGHPEPKALRVTRTVCWKSDRENAHLGDSRNVLEGIAIEETARRTGAYRSPTASQDPVLGMQRNPVAADEIASLDLRST